MITNIIHLLIPLILWVGYIILSSVLESIYDYIQQRPELKEAGNGVAWLRKNKMAKLYFWTRFTFYVYIIYSKLDGIELFSKGYPSLFIFFMLISIIAIPLCLFPYIHDHTYSRMYNFLLNQNSNKNSIFNPMINIDYYIIKSNEKLRNNSMIMASGLITIQILFIFFVK